MASLASVQGSKKWLRKHAAVSVSAKVTLMLNPACVNSGLLLLSLLNWIDHHHHSLVLQLKDATSEGDGLLVKAEAGSDDMGIY